MLSDPLNAMQCFWELLCCEGLVLVDGRFAGVLFGVCCPRIARRPRGKHLSTPKIMCLWNVDRGTESVGKSQEPCKEATGMLVGPPEMLSSLSVGARRCGLVS